MSHSKYRLRGLGLCLIAALSLLAISAAAAQAETGANWMVGGANIAANKSVTGKLDGTTNYPKLLSKIGGSTIGIECLEFEVTGGLIEPGGKSKGVLTFKSCHVYINGSLEPECMVKEPITATVKDLIVLDPSGGAEGYDLFSPETGTTFTEILFLGTKTPSLCTLPTEDIAITGTAVAKDCNNEFRVEKKEHLIAEVPAGLFPSDGLKFGKNAASLDGSVILEESTGANWSGLPA